MGNPKNDALYEGFPEYMDPFEVFEFLYEVKMPNVPGKHRPKNKRTIKAAMFNGVLPHEGNFTIHQNSVAPDFDHRCNVANFNAMGECAGVSGEVYQYWVKHSMRHAFRFIIHTLAAVTGQKWP